MSTFGRAAVISVVVLLAGCRGQTSTEPPVIPMRGMHDQPRYDPQSEQRYFDDGRAMRQPVEGTIAQEMVIDDVVGHGVDESGTYVATIPQEVIDRAGGMRELAERGHGRYDIYCSACHAYTGDGLGMVSRRAAEIGATFAAASFHDDRLRHAPDGQIFATITNGIRTMPAYRAQIPVQDRWAIVAYVRALQLAQADRRTAAVQHPQQEEATR